MLKADPFLFNPSRDGIYILETFLVLLVCLTEAIINRERKLIILVLLGYLGSSYGNREHIDGSFGYN